MMKKFMVGALILFASLGVIHVFLWQMNLPIQRLVRPGTVNVTRFSQFRSDYEKTQKDKLGQYQWVDKRNGYVQIPIERAFDYYLRTHPKL